MRIIILHNFYQHHGGEDTVVKQEADELAKRGHEILLLTTKNKKGIKGLMQFFLYPWNIFTSNSLQKKISKYNPDLIHIHNLHYATGPFIVSRLKKKGYPVVMTLHNYRLICPSATLFYDGKLFTKSITEDFPCTAVKEKVLDHSFLKTLITGFTYWLHKKIGTWRQIDRYFTFSSFSKEVFTSSKISIEPDKFVIKPNFVNIIESDTKVFGAHFVYIGRLSEEKGIIPLLEAISKTNFQLIIYGTGPQEEEVKVFAKKYTNINFLGFQDQETLHKAIQDANALIVPSVCYEGMPMTIIEAFACGTPVLCSDIGILKQMVVPLHTGLHFSPTASNSIIDTLEKWNDLDKLTKEEISKNCVFEYQQKYTKEKNLELMEDIYQQIIKENEHNNYRSS